MSQIPVPPAPSVSQGGRIVIGALGGFAALCTKFLAHDQTLFNEYLDSSNMQALWGLAIAYLIVGLIVMFLGGLLAWATEDERSHMKLLAIGVAAPALVTTWAGAAAPDRARPPVHAVIQTAPAALPAAAGWLFISPAMAADGTAAPGTGVSIKQGLRSFFGLRPDDDPSDVRVPAAPPAQRYWVAVGSFDNHQSAAVLANRLNGLDPALHAFVGKPRPNSATVPVIVGDYAGVDQANALLQKVQREAGVSDGFLDPYPDRR